MQFLRGLEAEAANEPSCRYAGIRVQRSCQEAQKTNFGDEKGS